MQGDELIDLEVELPIFKRNIKVVDDDQMKVYYGSGINAVSPAYYIDDLHLGMQLGLNKEGFVDENCKL
jgi:valyl-tRNA synthetase